MKLLRGNNQVRPRCKRLLVRWRNSQFSEAIYVERRSWQISGNKVVGDYFAVLCYLG